MPEPDRNNPVSLLSDSALSALAMVAGEGELQACAVRSLEESRAAIEITGWLLLQEVRLDDGVLIRHGLIGPGGIVVAVPSGAAPKYEHLEDVERQASALAQLLTADRSDIVAAIVVFDSDAAPSTQFYGRYSAVLVGDRQLPEWLFNLPTVISDETLADLRDAIFAHAVTAADAAKPMLLPREPLWG